jgi:hypothetical protein
MLGRLAWGCGLDSIVSGQGPVAGCYECGDEPSSSCATEVSIEVTLNGKQTDGQTDSRTNRQTDIQVDRHRERQAGDLISPFSFFKVGLKATLLIENAGGTYIYHSSLNG